MRQRSTVSDRGLLPLQKKALQAKMRRDLAGLTSVNRLEAPVLVATILVAAVAKIDFLIKRRRVGCHEWIRWEAEKQIETLATNGPSQGCAFRLGNAFSRIRG